ncbi:phosphoribosylanthranilate isomerase [Paenibacillus sp. P26]|nr:phosphoribosylanthranilate isomerase [Paenibacillus sp. P26]UUZ94435.1 phosphoribosylanthranilate isomerase [Paenibacillus sp. P25]
MTSVKICGLKSEEQVLATAALPVDHIGFVFARSKRQVTAEQAGAWIRSLHDAYPVDRRPLTVGVFVNPTREELYAVMKEAPLDVIQLHGQEDAEYCRWVKETFPGVRIFKALSLPVGADTGQSAFDSVLREQLQPLRPYTDAVLLDTYDPVYGGGSGKAFPWDAIPPFQAWCREAGIRLIVAGGLHPDNVRGSLDTYGPDGVDVSSGVETDGVKDITKIKSFVERVKRIV